MKGIRMQSPILTTIGTGGPTGELNLDEGLALFPKLGTARAGVSISGHSNALFDTGVTVLFSRLKASAYYGFFIGMVGPAVAFRFQSDVSMTNTSGGGTVTVDLPQQEMVAGMKIGMLFAGGLSVKEQLYLPSSWYSPWKFTWRTVFDETKSFEIDLLALFAKLINYLLTQGAQAGLWEEDTANTLAKFVPGKTFKFIGNGKGMIGPANSLTATASYTFPINLVTYIPALASFVKLLGRIKGDLSFGPALALAMPVSLGLSKFTIEGGQGSGFKADYGSLTYTSTGVIATGPTPFPDDASPSKLTTTVSYSSGFTVALSCYFRLSVCKIFSVSLNTASLDLLNLLGIPIPSTSHVTGSVSTDVQSGCVLTPQLSMNFAPSDGGGFGAPVRAGTPFLCEIDLDMPWQDQDSNIQLSISPPVSGFPSSVPILNGSNAAQFVHSIGNQRIPTGDPSRPAATQSPSSTSPYQTYSVTAKITPTISQPCADWEVTTALTLVNNVMVVDFQSGARGDAPDWNTSAGGQINADPSQPADPSQEVPDYVDCSYYFPYPDGSTPVPAAPVTLSLYGDQRQPYSASQVRISFSSGAVATLGPDQPVATVAVSMPPSSAPGTFRVEWLSQGPHVNYSTRFYLVIDGGGDFGQTEFWLSVWNWS
jgi:hypothetical protein